MSIYSFYVSSSNVVGFERAGINSDLELPANPFSCHLNKFLSVILLCIPRSNRHLINKKCDQCIKESIQTSHNSTRSIRINLNKEEVKSQRVEFMIVQKGNNTETGSPTRN